MDKIGYQLKSSSNDFFFLLIQCTRAKHGKPEQNNYDRKEVTGLYEHLISKPVSQPPTIYETLTSRVSALWINSYLKQDGSMEWRDEFKLM